MTTLFFGMLIGYFIIHPLNEWVSEEITMIKSKRKG